MRLSLYVKIAQLVTLARALPVALAAIAAPAAAMEALPAVGAQVGASPEEVRIVLDQAGCPVQSLAAEGGHVAVRCRDTAGDNWCVMVDPTTGRVTRVARTE